MASEKMAGDAKHPQGVHMSRAFSGAMAGY